MEIGSLSGTNLTGAASGSSQKVSSQDFMRLLTTQLANQSPLDPMSDTEFMGQLAQLSSVEQAETQNSLLQQILAGVRSTNVLEGIGNAASLVDREVTYADGGEVAQGRVDAVRFLDGLIQLEVGDKLVPLGNVLQVVSGSSSATEASAEEGASEAEEPAPETGDPVAGSSGSGGSSGASSSDSGDEGTEDGIFDDLAGVVAGDDLASDESDELADDAASDIQ